MAKIKKVIENGGIQYPATITDAVKNPNNGKTVTEELSELGRKVFNNSFEGKGETYSSVKLEGLIPSHTYRLDLYKKWSLGSIGEGLPSDSFLFNISYYIGSSRKDLVEVPIGGNLEEHYEFVVPSEYDYISIGGRAIEGEIVQFTIIDTDPLEIVDYNRHTALLTPKGEILSITEDNINDYGYATIEFKATSNRYIFWVKGVHGGKYFQYNPIVPQEFITDNKCVFSLQAGDALVMDYADADSSNIRIIKNKDITPNVIVLASCSYGKFNGGAFETIISEYRLSKLYLETSIISRIVGRSGDYKCGYYLSYRGNEIKSDNWAFTDFINVSYKDSIVWQYGEFLSDACCVCYDENKNILGAYRAIEGSKRSFTLNTENAKNIAYIRASFNLNYECFVSVSGEKVWSFASHEKRLEKIETELNNNDTYKFSIIGDDDNLVSYRIDTLRANNLYRIKFDNLWKHNNIISEDSFVFVVRVFKEDGEEVRPIVISRDKILSSEYIFSCPENNYIELALRADVGEVVNVMIDNVSGLIQYNEINIGEFVNGSYTNGPFKLNNNKNRLRSKKVIKAKAGSKIKVSANESQWVGIVVYSTNLIERFEELKYLKEAEYIATRDCKILFIIGKADNSDITLEEMTSNATVYNANVITDESFKQEKGKVSLFVGNLINSDSTNGQLTDSETYNNKRVITSCACAFPIENKTWHFKLPEDFYCYLWIGGSNGDVSKHTVSSLGLDWFRDGSYFNANTYKAYRVVFAAGSDKKTNISASQVQQLIESGDIQIYCDVEESSTNERNLDKNTQLSTLGRVLVNNHSDNRMWSCPIFVHISDVHGDVRRVKNALEFCDGFEKSLGLLVTGDVNMYNSRDGIDFMKEISERYSSPLYYCIGNHEAQPTGSATLYEDNMQFFAEKYAYTSDGQSVSDNCYWYKDFDDKKIRLIAINYYENGVYNGCLGQKQIDWLVRTLQSVPGDYGVLIILHSPEDKVIVDDEHKKFRQKHRIMDYQENGFYVGNRPIMQIVDAFIGREVYNGSYTDNGETVFINADFTNVPTTAEFIAYAVGHRHEDWVGYYANAKKKQLSLGITCATALYGDSSNHYWSNQSDLPRGGEGVSQDAINVYAIDRVNGNVKIVRIGANMTEDFTIRDNMVISYR